MENCTQTLESLILFLVKTAVKFRNYRLENFLTPRQTECFQFLSRLWTYLFWNKHSLKKNSTVCESGSLYALNQRIFLTNAFAFFKIEDILWNIEKKKQ